MLVEQQQFVSDPDGGLEMSVSEFVALLNQTLEYAYPNVAITGELSNLRVSKNRWLYFDLKDEFSTIKFFGTVYQLPGPLEDGMLLRVKGQPRVHPQYGFSVNVMRIQPAGEGTIRRAAELLKMKLAKEGLFEPNRKRSLPYPPVRAGLITSKHSAAYADFIKILNARWHGVAVELIDVQVQGDLAPAQITAAIEQFNEQALPPDVLVIIRGGGSAEDMAAFSTEQVTRAVAASRVPTLVAIGHEVDVCLAELAADQRASTPSNAAELLVPDRQQASSVLNDTAVELGRLAQRQLQNARLQISRQAGEFEKNIESILVRAKAGLNAQAELLEALNPEAVLRRGYAVVRSGSRPVRSYKALKTGDIVDVQLSEGGFRAAVDKIRKET